MNRTTIPVLFVWLVTVVTAFTQTNLFPKSDISPGQAVAIVSNLFQGMDVHAADALLKTNGLVGGWGLGCGDRWTQVYSLTNGGCLCLDVNGVPNSTNRFSNDGVLGRVRMYTNRPETFGGDSIEIPIRRKIDGEAAAPSSESSESGDSHGVRVVVTSMSSVEDGVFFFRNGFSSLILELRDGRYRYWFYSDVPLSDEPVYPLTGQYVAEGPSIKLKNQQLHMQDQWTFRKLNGETTLWRPTAITSWRDKRVFDYYGVLYPTKLTPEAIWQKDVWKTGPCDR